MERRMVIFDIDGTLLDDDKRIPDSTRRAVLGLQREGIDTVIATGRAPMQFEWIREELNMDSYVSLNGQLAIWRGEVVHAHAMDAQLLERVTAMAGGCGDAIGYCGQQELAASTDRHPLIVQSLKSLKLEPPKLDAEYFRHSPVYQGYLFCSEGAGPRYEQAFPEFRFIRWHDCAYDILPQGSSKAIGIAKLREAAGIANEHCFAFGDGINDVEMLGSVGTGIAMGNAVPEAKAAAKMVTTSNVEDGIWNGLVTVGLLA